MTTVKPPPVFDFLVDQDGKANLSWVVYFNSLYEGDSGTSWTPTFQSLTTVGTPTITGRYYRVGGRQLVYYTILVTPATSTTSTAGTTYINNFPLPTIGDSACLAVTGGIGSQAGHFIASTNRIFVPAWSAVTVPITIVGLCEVNG